MQKGSRKHKRADIIEAIGKSGGIIAAVARVLGCDRSTVTRYIRNDPKIAEAMDHARESFIDLAENKLMQMVNAGNLTAIIFTLKTLGKSRGYIEKQEIHTTSDKPFVMSPEQADSVYRKRRE